MHTNVLLLIIIVVSHSGALSISADSEREILKSEDGLMCGAYMLEIGLPLWHLQ